MGDIEVKQIAAFLFLIAALLFAPSLATPALTQQAATCGAASGAYGMILGGAASSPCYYATVNSDGSLKVSASGGAPIPYNPTALAGTQRGAAMATATALTIPATATAALISVAGTNNTAGICAYWQDDGTVPTVSAGNPLAAGQYLPYNAVGLPIKLIAATGATCTFNAAYYK